MNRVRRAWLVLATGLFACSEAFDYGGSTLGTGDGPRARGTGFLDADGDGFGDPSALVPADHGRGVRNGLDCDDGDPEVFPGAPEVPYDGVDQDCSGSVWHAGGVTFTFDDGWLSQHDVAAAILDEHGIAATFYVMSRMLQENGYADYMGVAELASLHQRGHEVGSHTRYHAHLTELSDADLELEVAGSRAELLALEVGPIASFCYPWGAHDARVMAVVAAAGYDSARSTVAGCGTTGLDPFALPARAVDVSVDLPEVTAWIEDGLARGEWVILNFHQVEDDGGPYSTPPDRFRQVVDFVVDQGVPTFTVGEVMRE